MRLHFICEAPVYVLPQLCFVCVLSAAAVPPENCFMFGFCVSCCAEIVLCP